MTQNVGGKRLFQRVPNFLSVQTRSLQDYRVPPQNAPEKRRVKENANVSFLRHTQKTARDHTFYSALLNVAGPYARGGLGGYEDPPNSQKYNKKVHTVCILKLSKMQGSFTTL